MTRVVVVAKEFEPTAPITIKVERFAASVDGAIALITPDDFGGLADGARLAAPRARENVWVEVGWFWGRPGRSKVLLLRKGSVAFPSDLGNVEHVAYRSSPIEDAAQQAIQLFIAKLRSASES